MTSISFGLILSWCFFIRIEVINQIGILTIRRGLWRLHQFWDNFWLNFLNLNFLFLKFLLDDFQVFSRLFQLLCKQLIVNDSHAFTEVLLSKLILLFFFSLTSLSLLLTQLSNELTGFLILLYLALFLVFKSLLEIWTQECLCWFLTSSFLFPL